MVVLALAPRLEERLGIRKPAATSAGSTPPTIEDRIASEIDRQYVIEEAKRRTLESRAPLTPLRVYSVAELLVEPSIDWLTNNIVARSTVTVFGGDGGVGKSATLIELATCIARGTPFLGQFPTVQGKTLYVAAEGRAGYGPRLNAVRRSHGAFPESGFALVDEGVSLTNDASMAQLCTFVADGGFDLVILDTLSQLAQVDSENDSAQMARVISQAKRITTARAGTSVLIAAHTNKASGTLRGSSAIRDNVDAVWMFKGTKDAFSLSNKQENGGKMRDGQPLSIGGLSLVQAHGSVVVEHADMPANSGGPSQSRASGLVQRLEVDVDYTTAQLFEMVKESDPTASAATIKRTIAGLSESGLIQRSGKGHYRVKNADGSWVSGAMTHQ